MGRRAGCVGTADSVVPLVLCACSERANDWGMTTSTPRPRTQRVVTDR